MPLVKAKNRRQTDSPAQESPNFASLLGLDISDTSELIARIQRGLPFTAWRNFLRSTSLPTDLACRTVNIPPRTLARRKEEGRFQPDESDRLVRVARIFGRAIDLWEGNIDSARSWMTSPALALRGSTPLEFAATEVGAREVELLIGRLEHGIPS